MGGWVGAGFEEDISHEPEVVDPKCGISIMNIPPDWINLVGVPEVKSKILDLGAWVYSRAGFGLKRYSLQGLQNLGSILYT